MTTSTNLLPLLGIAVTAMLAAWIITRRRRAEPTLQPAGEQAVPNPAAATAEELQSPPAPVEVAAPSGGGESSAESVISPITGGGGTGSRPLTDLLDGIELPYDLMPVTSAVEDPDRHLILLTTHSNAGEVGKRFADQLEGIGFELETVEFDQAIAQRNGDVISMKIVADADRVESGDGPRYGAAGRGDVALELWIGRSPRPPTAAD